MHTFGGGLTTISWNACQPHPEHELQACKCALAVQRRMAALRQWARDKFSCFMAVVTAPLIAGVTGTPARKTDVLGGAALHWAQRLVHLNEALDAPIVVSQAVYEGVHGTCRCVAADVVRFAGAAERTAVYELCAGPPLPGDDSDLYRRAFVDFVAERYAEVRPRAPPPPGFRLPSPLLLPSLRHALTRDSDADSTHRAEWGGISGEEKEEEEGGILRRLEKWRNPPPDFRGVRPTTSLRIQMQVGPERTGK